MKTKSVLAGLSCVALVLTGCAAADSELDSGPANDGGPSGTPQSTDTLIGLGSGASSSTLAPSLDPSNPWSLPLEQRPPLFDPCTEIPESALREAGFDPNKRDESDVENKPGQLISCSWSNKEVKVLIISSWKSYSQVSSDPRFHIREELVVNEHRGLLDYSGPRDSARELSGIFFSKRGTTVVTVMQNSALKTFQGKNFTPISVPFDYVSNILITYIPRGDFR